MAVDTVTLDEAFLLLSMPRVLGPDPSGEEIVSLNGRYGPYLKKGTERGRSIRGPDLHGHGRGRGEAVRRTETAAPGRPQKQLRELGDDPATGKPMVVKDGRFGPYVTDGEVNATIRGADTPKATISLERASELLAERRAKGPRQTAETAGAQPVTVVGKLLATLSVL